MDPTATLTAIRILVQCLDKHHEVQDWQETAQDLAWQIDALDTWMSRGGFLPQQWRPQR